MIARTTSPIVTGGSVVAVKFRGGVVLACDTMLSYGGTLKFKDICRIEQLEPDLFVAASGEYSDFMEVVRVLRNKSRESFLQADGVTFSHRDYGNFLRNLQYFKRNKFDPNFDTFVLAGVRGGQSFISTVDMYGDQFEQDSALTGMGRYFGTPLINNQWDKDCTEEQAIQAVGEVFKMLYLRDCKGHDQVDFLIVRESGVERRRAKVNGEWNYDMFRNHAN